ncbi:GHKL domain-containing protein [candidate division GN15 bacterium]|nr:GHKL domain-containing protein [candidate division GN15 bacterium]
MTARLALVVCLLAALLAFGLQAEDQRVIKVDSGDAAYLPYHLELIDSVDWGATKPLLSRPCQVLRKGATSQSSSTIVVAHNPPHNRDESMRFIVDELPFRSTDDRQFALTLGDWQIARGSREESDWVVGAGYRRDSAFVFVWDPATDSSSILYMASGQDTIGDGVWQPEMRVLLINDYDEDGVLEIFVQIFSPSEDHYRCLFCVEADPLSVEWFAPVTGYINRGQIRPYVTDTVPAVILCAYNPKNGVENTEFSDYWGQLAVINQQGEVQLNKKISHTHGGVHLTPGISGESYYVTHEIYDDFDTTYEMDPFDTGQYYVSMLDVSEQITCTTPLDGKPSDLWLTPYGVDDNRVALFVTSQYGFQVFDTGLAPLAVSDSVTMTEFLGTMRLNGAPDPVLVFRDGAYSPALVKLLDFPREATSFEVLNTDSLGFAEKLVLCAPNSYFVGQVREKSGLEYLSVFYHRNQLYVLMVLSGLVVGLMTTAYFGRRARRNLELIARQKAELERTHQELREAQDQLVAAEKFRQAKDIAGGFAHEIRNALMPAKVALLKQSQAWEAVATDPQRARQRQLQTREAIDRALALTGTIQDYTRLGSHSDRETVDLLRVIEEVADVNRKRIAEQGIRLQVDCPEEATVMSRRQDLFAIVNNLLLNSMDALMDSAEPTVSITVRVTNETVDMTFADNGMGIAPEKMSRIFDTFYSTKPADGTGLGLSLVKRIIEVYNGSIEVASTPGQGTTFTVCLPTANGGTPAHGD